MFRFVVLPCFDLGLTVPHIKYMYVYYCWMFDGCVVMKLQVLGEWLLEEALGLSSIPHQCTVCGGSAPIQGAGGR